nr:MULTISPECIES: SDR family oxidoreductase [unclassified Methylobacterium]
MTDLPTPRAPADGPAPDAPPRARPSWPKGIRPHPSLAKGLSKAYGPDGVLVNAVGPAFIATPMTDAQMEKEKGISFDEAIRQTLDEERPGMVAKRRGKAEEVAAAIVFLCSERASFITGEFLWVDGGSVMTMGA